jgi:hypothetical protein
MKIVVQSLEESNTYIHNLYMLLDHKLQESINLKD